MQDHPLLDGHPVLGVRRWTHRAIPISVHGDGVPVTGVGKAWGKSMEVLSWASCLAAGTTLGTFNLIYAIFATACNEEADTHTMRQFFIRLKWSFDQLYEGAWSANDWHGNPWPVGSPNALKAGKPLCGDGDNLF